MARVHLFMDYQNMHLSVLEAFAPLGTPAHQVLIHPGLFADAVMKARTRNHRHGDLEEIHVYRGQPSSTHEPVPASRNKAQAAEWTKDRRVRMHARPLRYPRNWPRDRQREKGVDVMLACDVVRCAIEKRAETLIIASRDTDLVPALEMAYDQGVEVEVVTWHGCSRLRFPGHDRGSLWCTILHGGGYMESKDPRAYP